MIRQGQKKKTKDLKKALRFIEKFQEHPQKKGLVSWSVGQFIFRTICTTLSPQKTYSKGRVS